jgi:hypothetical protein
MNQYQMQLRRQLGFLQRSCETFDAGYLDEAIRIGTCVRVLVHNTSKSTSLLAHLGATGIRLLTTCNPAHVTGDVIVYDGLTNFGASGQVPKLGRGFKAEIPLSEWWEQLVFVIRETRIRRRDLVLVAC